MKMKFNSRAAHVNAVTDILDSQDSDRLGTVKHGLARVRDSRQFLSLAIWNEDGNVVPFAAGDESLLKAFAAKAAAAAGAANDPPVSGTDKFAVKIFGNGVAVVYPAAPSLKERVKAWGVAHGIIGYSNHINVCKPV